MVKGGERIMIVESLEGGNKKRKKDCSKGKREEQEKEIKIVQGVKGRNKKRKERWRMVLKGRRKEEERKKE
uniref:hypothetical protein n=1 Tax=Prevotella sp. TaxID=59823 RepID=UPI004024DB79